MNPFTYGRVVSQKNYCVRPEFEAKLKARTLACQNTYLEGERRNGIAPYMRNFRKLVVNRHFSICEQPREYML